MPILLFKVAFPLNDYIFRQLSYSVFLCKKYFPVNMIFFLIYVSYSGSQKVILALFLSKNQNKTKNKQKQDTTDKFYKERYMEKFTQLYSVLFKNFL